MKYFLFATYVLAGLLSLGSIFVPRNPIYGFKCKWTLADPIVWKKVNRAAGMSMFILCAIFAGLSFFWENEKTLFFAIVYFCIAVLLIMAALFVYAKNLYDERMKENATTCVPETLDADISGLKKFFIITNAHKKFGFAFSAALFLGATLWSYLQFCAPFWDEKIAIHFGSDGTANGWMTGRENFYFSGGLLLILGAFCYFVFICLSKFSPLKNKDVSDALQKIWAFSMHAFFWCSVFFIQAVSFAIFVSNKSEPAKMVWPLGANLLFGACGICLFLFFALTALGSVIHIKYQNLLSKSILEAASADADAKEIAK